MKEEQFKLLKDFHFSLIRAKPSELTVTNAKKVLVDGDKRLLGVGRDERFKAKKLAGNLEQRHDDLVKFAASDFEGKINIYSRAYSKKPTKGVFYALEEILADDGLKIGAVARKYNVNFQCVKVLKPRFERYITYSSALAKSN